MEPVLKLINLTKIYKTTHLWKTYKTIGVNGLNLEINKGEIFSIIGPNGSGKTTIIKLILDFIKPTNGEVYVFNKKTNDREIFKKIGYVPEVINLPKFLKVKEIINLLAGLSGINTNGGKKIEQLLEKLELKEHANKLISELSKGLIQRVAIAQALVHEPELLILDEPVSGLDPLGIRFMRDLMLSLKSQGRTIFFSSHFISEVEKISDRVGILKNGELKKIVEQKEFKDRPLEEIFISTMHQ